tara:strand:+ start:47 stop:457 length:411 start_codon:yes stop_codon:yes gene_type:complete
VWLSEDIRLFDIIKKKIGSILKKRSQSRPVLDYLDEQDLSRFSDQDIVLETEDQIQEFLPEVLGQALARTWIDKRFLEAFYEYPEEILERGGVYLPDHISVEFMKKDKSRPKVVVYENGNKKRKIIELKLIMVADE